MLCKNKHSLKKFFLKFYKYGAGNRIREHAAAEGTWVGWSKLILNEAHIEILKAKSFPSNSPLVPDASGTCS